MVKVTVQQVQCHLAWIFFATLTPASCLSSHIVETNRAWVSGRCWFPTTGRSTGASPRPFR